MLLFSGPGRDSYPYRMEEEVPETPASDIDGEPVDYAEVLRAALLWSADSDPDPEYPIACFSVLSSEGDLKISYILITEV